MATIEERAEEAWVLYEYREGNLYHNTFADGYCQGATEQRAIDDAELARLKKAWEKEAEVNHDAAMAYKQGHHDAISKACEWLRVRNVLTEDSIKGFRNAMEE